MLHPVQNASEIRKIVANYVNAYKKTYIFEVGAIRHVVVRLALSEQECLTAHTKLLKQRLTPSIRPVPAKDTAQMQQTESRTHQNVTYLC